MEIDIITSRKKFTNIHFHYRNYEKKDYNNIHFHAAKIMLLKITVNLKKRKHRLSVEFFFSCAVKILQSGNSKVLQSLRLPKSTLIAQGLYESHISGRKIKLDFA